MIENPKTIATAIRIGNPASWQEAEQAADESQGKIDSVTDEEILQAYSLIARQEGIFCEPSSAASLAGLIKHLALGTIGQDATITCVLTGNGLKDPATAMDLVTSDLAAVPPEPAKLKEVMGL